MTAARVYVLDAYRRTEPVPTTPRRQGGEAPFRRGLPYRISHSPLARDLRANPLAAGLLLAVLLVVLWSAW